jgi:hypothetical protein
MIRVPAMDARIMFTILIYVNIITPTVLGLPPHWHMKPEDISCEFYKSENFTHATKEILFFYYD